MVHGGEAAPQGPHGVRSPPDSIEGDVNMLPMNAKRKKVHEQLHAVRVNFLREQDGLSERELKDHLSPIIRADQNLLRAYLARVTYGDSPAASVALCLRSTAGPSLSVVENIEKVFGSMFGSHAHLDIIFISENQESELIRCCRSFFRRVDV